MNFPLEFKSGVSNLIDDAVEKKNSILENHLSQKSLGQGEREPPTKGFNPKIMRLDSPLDLPIHFASHFAKQGILLRAKVAQLDPGLKLN